MSRKVITFGPTISLEQALESRFVLKGTTYEVGSCPIAILRQLVRARLPENKKERKYLVLQKLLGMLEENADELTRWYVIETLISQKALKRSYFVDGQVDET